MFGNSIEIRIFKQIFSFNDAHPLKKTLIKKLIWSILKFLLSSNWHFKNEHHTEYNSMDLEKFMQQTQKHTISA